MAQGHMVMGQEERRNRAKLEKTQISVATSNTEYEAAVKILEETTARWNREWKAAADKFQDLEEERLDFTKSSLWTFANLASTVCVSDDASCEKIRLSLEQMEVEKDIMSFITDKGTGQEIPDAPKYINFCRGDVGDNQSEVSEDDNFSVAQFPRAINPAFRSSSPQPSTFESHHDPNSALANNLAHRDAAPSHSRESLPLQQQQSAPQPSREVTLTPQQQHLRRSMEEQQQPRRSTESQRLRMTPTNQRSQDRSPYDRNQYGTAVAEQPAASRSREALPLQQQQPASLKSRDLSLTPQQPPPMRRSFEEHQQPRRSMEDQRQRLPPTSQRSYDAYQPGIMAAEHQPAPLITNQVTYTSPRQPMNTREIALPSQNRPAPLDRRQSSFTPQAPARASSRETTQSPQKQSVTSNSRESNYTPQKQHALQHSRESTYSPQKQPVLSNTKESTHTPQNQAASLNTRDTDVTTQKQPIHFQQSVEEQPQRPPTMATRSYDAGQHGPISVVPHDPYPLDGMTMLCRTGPLSDRSSQVTSNRPSSKDENSDYATSFSSAEPPSGKTSPIKLDPLPQASSSPTKSMFKKKSGFFQNHSPFRRKSVKEVQSPVQTTSRNTWHVPAAQNQGSPTRRLQPFESEPQQPRTVLHERTHSPDPIDANASVALGVGDNVLPVSKPDSKRRRETEPAKAAKDEPDPIAMALAELKTVTLGKQSSVRMSADQYHGIVTPVPGTPAANANRTQSIPIPGSQDAAAASRGTPPPTYQPAQAQSTPVSRLGVPPPACTSKAMKEATKKATAQARSVYGDAGRGDTSAHSTSPSSRSVYGTSPSSRPGTRGTDVPRAVSPVPAPAQASARSVSPQPQRQGTSASRRMNNRSVSPNPQASAREVSPAPYAEQQRPQSSYYQGHQQRNSSPAPRRGSEQPYYRQPSPNPSARAVSPAPYAEQQRPQSSYAPFTEQQRPQSSYASFTEQQRPQSSYSTKNMAVQLADPYGSQRSRHGRPDSRASAMYDGDARHGVADPSRLYTPDGRPILHYGKS